MIKDIGIVKKPKTDLSGVALPIEKAEYMHKIGYRFVGAHSAIKICEWTRECIRGTGVCYKKKFYGIETNRCIQMSPAVQFCDFNCMHCWRSLNYTMPPDDFQWDDPKFILDSCIEEQKKILQGFWGSEDSDKTFLEKAMKPNQVAISLSGEPTLYPRLPGFIDDVLSRKMTAFLVTNGAHPDAVKKLLDHQPTNLYVTLPAPNRELFMKECCPMANVKTSWENILETLSLLKEFKTRTVIRLTLNKKHNLCKSDEYAKILENSQSSFIECKGYMAIGGAREKIGPEFMASHEEIREFSEQLEKLTSYRIINEKEDSRVVLLGK